MPKNDHGRSSDMKKRDSLKGEDDDWRGTALSRIGKLIKQADPEVVEERKWRKPTNPEGVPVWSHGGMICTGETYKNHVKITFARCASLKIDCTTPFNASLEGNACGAIDIHDGKKIDEEAFQGSHPSGCGAERGLGPPQMNRSRILPGSDWSGLASVDGLKTSEERGPAQFDGTGTGSATGTKSAEAIAAFGTKSITGSTTVYPSSSPDTSSSVRRVRIPGKDRGEEVAQQQQPRPRRAACRAQPDILLQLRHQEHADECPELPDPGGNAMSGSAHAHWVHLGRQDERRGVGSELDEEVAEAEIARKGAKAVVRTGTAPSTRKAIAMTAKPMNCNRRCPIRSILATAMMYPGNAKIMKMASVQNSLVSRLAPGATSLRMLGSDNVFP